MTKPVDGAEALSPFRVSRSSDGTRHWFSARDPASGVTIPATSREDAYSLTLSLNRAMLTHSAALVAENERLREGLEEARLQLEYLDERFPTGTTPAVLARGRTALETRNG